MEDAKRMAEREGEVTRVLRKVARTLDRGQYDQALRDLLHLSEKYPEAGEIRPQIAEVLIRRGESRARRGKAREARADFERSLTWSKKPGALVALARALVADGQLDRADELLNAALEIDDRHGPTHEALGELFLKWNEYQEAARAFEQALGCGYGTPELYHAVWTAYLRLERFERAHELILEGAERFPTSDALQAAAGDSFVYAKGTSEEARPYWEKAVELNPRNFGALFSLAGLAASRGERATAIDRLGRAAAIDLEKARKMWRDDLQSPLGRFAGFARDADFRRALGWEND
jgi:tetratricopeptide (TPR) repeat protein